MERKSTTPHYLINSNKVCENNLKRKTLLKENNTISIKNDQTESEIECIVMNSKGEKVFSEIIKGHAIISFESKPGEGIIKLVLSNGKHDAMIIINGDKLPEE